MPMNQTSPNSLKAGDVVARRYVVLRHLRDEPCGGVWLAQDRSLGVDVGLKFMPRQSPTFEAVREALRREGALALKLRHPHILQAVHFEEGEEGVYLIQELFLGESLLAHLNRLQRFRLPYALTLLEQMSQALAYAHQHHEVHHALDPSNILLGDDTVKLANFACPPQEEEEPQVTRLELKAYVAPEVIQGDQVSPAANVFSLGVLGFRLSAGSLPYSLTFDEAVPYRLENMPADLEEIPLPLQNLLLQCLAPDPRDRFEDAGAFLAALEQRRESWRTPSYGKWLGWTPERQQQAAGVMESVSRICGQFWEGSKGAAGRITEGIQSLRENGDKGMARRLLIGITGALLALTLLVWGGRTLLRKTGTPPAPALSTAAPSAPEPTAASEIKPPAAGVPPLKAAFETAPAPRAPVAATPAATPAATAAAPKATPAAKEHYQLWVATYRTYDDALVLKKKIQAKNIPVKVYRGAADKKVYFAVKAGPFASKKQAEDTANRLKSALHLAQSPKLVKIKEEAPKTSLPKSHR
jgi:cell division septation protein DedD